MSLTARDGVYYVTCPEGAESALIATGFNPPKDLDGTEWWTEDTTCAAALRDHADDAAKLELAKPTRKDAPLLSPENGARWPHVAEVGFLWRAGQRQASIMVSYPERNEELRALVKDYGFYWSVNHWHRHASAREGTNFIDRAAEIASLLLDAGFDVRVGSPETFRRVVEDSFEPEATSLVHFTMTPNLGPRAFELKWKRSEDYYDMARSLPGARYRRSEGFPGAVYVPLDAADAVVDFAEMHGFMLTEDAKKAVERHKESVLAKVLVKRKPRRAPIKAASPGRRPPQIDVVGQEGVDASLLDN